MAGVVTFSYPMRPAALSVGSRGSSAISAQLEEASSSTATKDSQADGSSGTICPPPGFKSPQPRRFYVRGDKWGAILSASLALPLRLGTGAFVQGYKAFWVPESEIQPNQYALFQVAGRKLVETSNLGPRPEKPIEIYEFESCPFCRKVDPNTNVSMYESDDIIKYLVEKYGDGNIPMMLSLGFFTTLTAGLAMIGRLGRGSFYTPARLPTNPLELWAYEVSPFCKIVREALVELELPHIYHCTGRGSPNRQKLFEKTGYFQVPYLEDPNTGVKMFESAEIVDYLQATYAISVDQST